MGQVLLCKRFLNSASLLTRDVFPLGWVGGGGEEREGVQLWVPRLDFHLLYHWNHLLICSQEYYSAVFHMITECKIKWKWYFLNNHWELKEFSWNQLYHSYRTKKYYAYEFLEIQFFKNKAKLEHVVCREF